MEQLTTLPELAAHIGRVHEQSQRTAVQQVNSWLSIRNWLIGFYIAEYEQHGADRAVYGEKMVKELAKRLSKTGLSTQQLYHYRAFYRTYPQIFPTVSGKLAEAGWQEAKLLNENASVILQTLSAKSTDFPATNPDLLLSRLSFSHFVELLTIETPLKRAFYEVQTISNNWSVRELKRALETSLYERTGRSKDKAAVLAAHTGHGLPTVADVLREPYVLEFLNLPDSLALRESDLEAAIVGQLERFLLEMGRGFCFEARQKRLTFDNDHLFVDLVFYHRILKCHVLVDLKIGAFSHADAGQMNVYLNYYREHEMSAGDNPPIGIILCAQKNDALVHYATGGLSQQVFASRYLLNLPTEAELRRLIEGEQDRLAAEPRVRYAVSPN